MTNLGWYPGHMTKAVRMMEEDLRLVDALIELADARIPVSSRNPDIDRLFKDKFRILIFNKADLADPKENEKIKEYFEKMGQSVMFTDARDRSNAADIKRILRQQCSSKLERDRKRGIIGRPLRAMVAGIPNVGKSTLINSFIGKASAKTGNKPGVTRGKQWLRMDKDIELLDTPGILWPKLEGERTGINLALTGSIREEILPLEELAQALTEYVNNHYAGLLMEKYGGEDIESIAVSRNLLVKGGEPDLNRAVRLLLDDFRNGKMGRISLESIV
ncbi:MAG: ribosome biogenesis GTPase YlqF [Lachnospiraceae bacterium]|nr:ribosome biogenesis GTPase YlqF [Lachnospiraceae bacterium]